MMGLLLSFTAASSALATDPAAAPDSAGYILTAWADTEGNRFRVNSPDTSEGPFKDRPEARHDGRMTINVDVPLQHVRRAELYLELWGGHPGVANKRFTVNGGGTLALPEVGAAAKHCTYSYPAVELPLDQLKRGENVFQFTCDKGQTFWGHYLIRAAAVRLYLDAGHPALAGRPAAPGALEADPAAEAETIRLRLVGEPADLARVARVDFLGFYDGFDENGNGRTRDWHGFTKDRKPVGHLGSTAQPPHRFAWDTAMLPDQPDVAARAVVHFADAPNLTYLTPPVTGIALPRAPGAHVSRIGSNDLPQPFWSRADQPRACTLDLPIDPARIEAVELAVNLWDGGRGDTAEPFTLNGRAVDLAGAGHHDVLLRRLALEPALLRRGPNTFRVLSDTEHHGIEVLLPGPNLLVRYR